MKKGFVLISTLSIIAILAVLTLFINSMVISSALTISNFNESVEQQNLNEVFPNSKLTTRNIGNIGIYQELSVELITQENKQLNIVILR